MQHDMDTIKTRFPRVSFAEWNGEDMSCESIQRYMRSNLKGSRQRGVSGHWTYNQNVHGEQLTIYRAFCGANGLES